MMLLFSLHPHILSRTPRAEETLEVSLTLLCTALYQSLCLRSHKLSSSTSRAFRVSDEHQTLNVLTFQSQNILGKCKASYDSPFMIAFPAAFFMFLLIASAPTPGQTPPHHSITLKVGNLITNLTLLFSLSYIPPWNLSSSCLSLPCRCQDSSRVCSHVRMTCFLRTVYSVLRPACMFSDEGVGTPLLHKTSNSIGLKSAIIVLQRVPLCGLMHQRCEWKPLL